MGYYFVDKFTILHFLLGIIAYYIGISFVLWIITHVTFEILENTKEGMYFITTYLTFWPGGKKSPDTLMNSLGDNIFAILGWLFGYWIDNLLNT
jgi:hypothetical protein